MSVTGRIDRRGPFPVKLRRLEVLRVTTLSPRIIRVTLGGPDLAGFRTDAPDDHVKLFFPEDGAAPTPGAEGRLFAEGTVRPPSRDYTPRRYDPVAGELDIDFVVHGEGPASAWAASAEPGAALLAAGPRASVVVSDDFDWYLLVGDDTALPAIARRIEEAPAGARILAFVEVDGPADEQRLDTRADAHVTWLHRGDAAPGSADSLEKAVRAADLPGGDYFAFVAGETAAVRRIRTHLLLDRGATPDRVLAKGYWKLGTADDGRA